MKKFMKEQYTEELTETKKFFSFKLCKRKIRKFMNLTTINVFMALVTAYALLGDDFRLLYAPIESDDTFTTLSIISLALFIVEIALSSIGIEHYFLSFFFWLDLMATGSMITDIEPIMNAFTSTDNSMVDSDNPIALARASRGARVGTKAARMVRVVQLIKLVRIVKLWKSMDNVLKSREEAKLEGDCDICPELKLYQRETESIKVDMEQKREELQQALRY